MTALAEQLGHYGLFRNSINDCKDQCGLFNSRNNSETHQ